MEPFEVAGQRYKAAKMDAITQFHVARRFAPALSSIKDIRAAATAAAGEDKLLAVEAMAPLLDAVAKMPDDHVDYVLAACLGVCQREQRNGTGWSAVWSQEAKRPMFEDIDMVAMLQIVAKVIWGQLSGFFPDLPSALSGEAAA
jgi:hypothetical protein